MTPLLIQAVNLFCFTEPLTFDFTTGRSFLISGPNGVGKTSLFVDAMLLALYGKARQKAEDCIRTDAGQGAVVFAFEHQGVACQISRVFTRGKSQHVKFSQNGQDVSERLASATDAKIRDFLGFSQRLFESTCLTRQNQAAFFTDLDPSERASVLMELLDLSIWEKKKTVIQRWLSAHRYTEEEREQLQQNMHAERTRIAACEHAIAEHHTLLEDQTRVVLQLEAEEEKRITGNVAYGDMFRLALGEFERDSARFRRIEAELETLPRRKDIESALSEIDQHLHAIERSTAQIRTTIAPLLEEQQRLTAIHTEGKALLLLDTSQLTRVPCQPYPALHVGCPLLGQAHEVADRQLSFLMTYFPQSDSLPASLTQVGERLAQVKLETERLTGFDIQFGGEKTRLAATRAKKVEDLIRTERSALLISERAALYQALQKNHAIMEETKAYAETAGQLAVLREQLAAARALSQRTQHEIHGYELMITRARTELTAMTARFEKLTSTLQLTAKAKLLHQTYTDIPSILFYETLPWIEDRANEILAAIFPSHRLEMVVFRPTKDGGQTRSLELRCHGPEGVKPFSALSNSEQFRFTLALRLAMARTLTEMHNAPLDFFLIDEGFGCLDQVNCALIKDSLRAVAEQFRLFIVLTHVEELKDTFGCEVYMQRREPHLSLVRHTGQGAIALDV